MTLESSAELMDRIFDSEDEEMKGRLLKIMQDFLSSESAKHLAQEKGLAPLSFRISHSSHIICSKFFTENQ